MCSYLSVPARSIGTAPEMPVEACLKQIRLGAHKPLTPFPSPIVVLSAPSLPPPFPSTRFLPPPPPSPFASACFALALAGAATAAGQPQDEVAHQVRSVVLSFRGAVAVSVEEQQPGVCGRVGRG